MRAKPTYKGGWGDYMGRGDNWIVRVMKNTSEGQGGCWNWTGHILPNGYGKTHIEGKVWLVHRLTYTKVIGGIPPQLQIDHLCRNRACCNPWHLEAVTLQENLRRGKSHTHLRDRTHCKHGHEYTPQNTHVDKRGHRNCRACHNMQERGRKRLASMEVAK